MSHQKSAFSSAKESLLNQPVLRKLASSFLSVIPIVFLVSILFFSKLFPQFSLQNYLVFLFSALGIGFGLALFTSGAESSLQKIGSMIGETLFKKQRLWLIVAMTFLLGILVTVAEPDLKVLAHQIGWSEWLLIVGVGLGVGVFLVIGVLRILFKKSLNILFLAFYAIVFSLTGIVNKKFLPIFFDSGGVATGPVIVPFILAFGAGLASSRSGSGRSGEDAFGLTALASVGPIITMMILSLFLDVDNMVFPWSPSSIVIFPSEWGSFFAELGDLSKSVFSQELLSVALAVIPLGLFFLFYNAIFVHLGRKSVLRIFIGLVYAYFGLVLFLGSVNIGFLPLAQEIGYSIGEGGLVNMGILIGAFFGIFGVLAEPAVHILVRQIESVSEGTIKSKTILALMAGSIGLGVALSVIRALYHFDILYLLLPGYALALGFSFLSPKIYTSIAFDSGGVASGPIASAFVMPYVAGFAYGVAETSGIANISDYVFANAFGCVSMITMMPLLVIQLLGLYSEIKRNVINKQLQKDFLGKDDCQVIYFDQEGA